MSFIVTGRDIPANCFRCPLDKGVWKQEQDPFILCRYTKEIVRYDDVPTDRRLPCCGLKEMPEKHGRLIDVKALDYAFTALRFNDDGTLRHWDDRKNWCLHGSEVESLIENAETIVEAEGE